ncbi:MAG TPA: DNA polymerase I [Bacteroidia bacterium]|nr:DNA polymerase I [Bacteroidia bacterium]
MNKKLFLLDAYALIYRSYFAFANSPRINSSGLNTSAIFGFTNTILEVIKKEQPTHIAVVFDTSAPTHRHTEFEAYKAHREEMPEDLRKAIPYIYKLLEALNIPAIESDGFEADDVIGTLAKRAEEKGFITYMMTPDKDFGQLVSENIFIYKPGYKGGPPEKLGIKEICAKYGIERADQVIDILGLMGDTADNIPGIRGVGEKTALNLIHEFGTVENVLKNTDKLKGKLKEKVEAGKENAILSRMLATIIVDAPIPFDEEQLRAKEIHKDKVKTLFTELEFRRLAQTLLGEELPQTEEKTKEKELGEDGPSKKTKAGQMDIFGHTGSTEEEKEETEEEKNYDTIEKVKHKYHLADTAAKRKELVAELGKLKQFCFDTETTGLDTLTAELVGMSFSWKEKEAWYVPVPENQDEAQKIVNEFKTVFANEKITKIGQNIKYDLNVLKNYGVEINGVLFDTMIAHYLLNPDMRHGMDILAETYLNYSPVSIETLIGKKGKGQISMRDVPVEKISEYAAEDADITWQLQTCFAPKLKEANAQKLFDEVEMPLVPVLADMEREGIAIDTATLKKYSAQLEKEITAIDSEIQKLAGTPFNISSPKQVGDILFDVLKIAEKPKKTKTGQYATGEDILQKLIRNHPIVEKILEYREMVKLKNTYIDTLPEMVNPKTGRIHTSYNQVVAATGRLSSDNPNLQNIPVRSERGREIRKAFIPRNKNYVLLSADYSQIELRIVASICGDKNMCDAFREGKDIHTATAARVYGIAEKDVTKEMRYKAKSVNFGIIYGQGAFGLAENLGISRGEAKELIENYFREYSGVKKYMDDMINFAREYGYVQTILGRRRYLRDITSANAVVRGFAERNAIIAPIQGSAADMIKVAMINVHAALQKNKFETKLLLQVHDELVFDVPEPEVEKVKPVIEEAMVNALKLEVPVEVGIGVGKTWLEAH